ncbi:MAG: hypothetical protein AB3N18_13110, partial [Allomuricauda sp.]
NEFQEKAEANIIHSARIETNYLKSLVLLINDGFVEHRVRFYVKFTINDSQFVIKDEVDGFEWRDELKTAYGGYGHEAILKVVHDRLSKFIALELMKSNEELMKELRTKKF